MLQIIASSLGTAIEFLHAIVHKRLNLIITYFAQKFKLVYFNALETSKMDVASYAWPRNETWMTIVAASNIPFIENW